MKLSAWILALLIPISAFTQNFTWMRGSVNAGSVGQYGTMGVASATNDPGARHGSATWTDAQGNLWLFGGEGFSTNNTLCWLNDLWKHNVTTNEWTWIRGSNGPNSAGTYGTKGISSASNDPGAREFMCYWTDVSGNFWMFGGDGYGSSSTFGKLSDLWKYNPSSNEWTWVNGPSAVDQFGSYGTLGTAASTNVPGGRYGSAKWTDLAGNFWLFGGRGFASTGAVHLLSDLWKYDVSTNMWTWVAGPNVISQSGTYGTMGTGATTNNPGAREFSTAWTADNGQLYLYAGRGYPTSLPLGYLNDLWKFDPQAGTSAWIHGTNITNQVGIYGTLGVAAPTVVPGARIAMAAWKDPSGRFWLFGGYGYASSGLHNYLNDLFSYDPSTNEWTWMKGSNTSNQNGNYGTQTVAHINNIPGGRYHKNYWTGSNGKFWLFGGYGMDDTSSMPEQLNDLWLFNVPCNPDSIVALPSSLICMGDTVNLQAFTQYSSSVVWYGSATSTVSIGNGSVFNAGYLSATNSITVYNYFAEANSCTISPRTQISITVTPLPQVLASGPSTICGGQIATFTATGANTYSWSTGQAGASASLIVLSPATSVTVIGYNSPNCYQSDTIFLAVSSSPTLQVVSTQSVLCSGKMATLTAAGASSLTWGFGQSPTLVITPSITTIYTVTGTNPNGCQVTSLITQSVTSCLSVMERITSNPTAYVYPNPASRQFTIRVNDQIMGATFILFDVLGRMQTTLILPATNNSIELSCPPGFYTYLIDYQKNIVGSGKLILKD